MQNVKDEDLIKEFLNGNGKAFEELVNLYYSDVYRLCYYYVKDKVEVEDLCQEIFFSVYKNLWRFRNEVPFKIWLFKIVYNKSMDFLRKNPTYEKNKYIIEEDSQLPTEHQQSVTYNQGYLSVELKRIINFVLTQLPEKTRSIVELFYYSKFTCKEIAEICDMSEVAVKTALSRAREKLREKLIHYYKG